MSIRITEKVTCPKCGFQYEFECYPSVNAKTDPDLREKVMDGNAFVSFCPSCKVTTQVVYPCFYQDPDRDFAVYMIPKTEAREFPCDGDMNSLFEATDITRRRIADCYNALREKIVLFEEGYNDFVMELFKAYCGVSMVGKPTAEESQKPFVPNEIYYRGLVDDKEVLLLGISGDEKRKLSVPKQLYDMLLNDYGKLIGEAKDFQMIDMLWALNFLKEQHVKFDD